MKSEMKRECLGRKSFVKLRVKINNMSSVFSVGYLPSVKQKLIVQLWLCILE